MSETAKNNKGLYWILTLVSLAATVLMLMYADSWFWVGLPFLFTFLAKGLDVM
jgi:hypothetical protein